MKKGYHKITFQSGKVKLRYWNGDEWERFPSDEIVHEEIEKIEAFSVKGVGSGGPGDDPDQK